MLFKLDLDNRRVNHSLMVESLMRKLISDVKDYELKEDLLFIAKYHDIGYHDIEKYHPLHEVNGAYIILKHFKDFEISYEKAQFYAKFIAHHGSAYYKAQSRGYDFSFLEQFEFSEKELKMLNLLDYCDTHATSEKHLTWTERKEEIFKRIKGTEWEKPFKKSLIYSDPYFCKIEKNIDFAIREKNIMNFVPIQILDFSKIKREDI